MLLTLIVLLPLAGFFANGLFGNRLGKPFVTVVGCALPLLAFAIAIKSFLDLLAGGGAPIVETAFTWARIGGQAFDIAFWFDRLSAVMVLIVTGVGSLIHIYSIGYMKEDKSYARFFAYLNLFLFFMLLLVLGRSLLVLFVGWEGVGLASYLLIGFWFEEADNARAGKKAFITNRVGDAGFLLGMFLLYWATGTLEMDKINAAFMGPAAPAVSASLVGILLFIGASANPRRSRCTSGFPTRWPARRRFPR
jgi:NADH-quinone oxidoreductase subunit L